MKFLGSLAKMRTVAQDPIRYVLELGDDLVVMNQLLGKEVHLRYTGEIQCFCGKLVTEVYRQNFCRSCFWSKPEAGEAILRPELSKAHLGIADRDLEWEKAYQLQPHIVYLANSGGLKVGVTREEQVPTRWIDQGATAAIVLARTPHRQLAGAIEVALKEHVSDKTHWQRMLAPVDPEIDLQGEKKRLSALLPGDLIGFVTEEMQVNTLRYPVIEAPAKPIRFNLEKEGELRSSLMGIRGQYLMFQNNLVMNVRSLEGRIVELAF